MRLEWGGLIEEIGIHGEQQRGNCTQPHGIMGRRCEANDLVGVKRKRDEEKGYIVPDLDVGGKR